MRQDTFFFNQIWSATEKGFLWVVSSQQASRMDFLRVASSHHNSAGLLVVSSGIV